jgi:hypothetical protein
MSSWKDNTKDSVRESFNNIIKRSGYRDSTGDEMVTYYRAGTATDHVLSTKITDCSSFAVPYNLSDHSSIIINYSGERRIKPVTLI